MEWFDIIDNRPKDDSNVIAADIKRGKIYSMAACWFIHGEFRVYDGLEASNFDGGAEIRIDFDVTHWFYAPDMDSQKQS